MRQRLSRLFLEFFQSERTSGILLILCTILSIALSNSSFGNAYHDLWKTKIGFSIGFINLSYDLEHWINDGLMAIFFLLIGLEIERELYIGELSDLKTASLPILAAFGGMLIPAAIYLALNWNGATRNGFGIPMATDIAFALGILSLAGNRVPQGLKVFLTALAIIDDLGAILVIALFYSKDFTPFYLGLAALVFGMLLVMNRMGVRRLFLYLVLGVLMWFLILQSGVHAAIAGILLAFALPFEQGREESLSYRLQHFLHQPVAFIIMPLFALANTGIVLAGVSMRELFTSNTLGIFLGLIIGKPLGIILFSLVAVSIGISNWPSGVYRRHLVGAGFLGGIGFTMAIFITFLAFGDTEIAQYSKLAILLSSLLSGVLGYLFLIEPGMNSR